MPREDSATEQAKPEVFVDCAARMPVCQAVCCKLGHSSVGREALGGRLRLGPREALPAAARGGRPLHAPGARDGVLRASTTTGHKPCRRYSCAGDRRIWRDFEGMVLNQEWIDANLGGAGGLQLIQLEPRPSRGCGAARAALVNGVLSHRSGRILPGHDGRVACHRSTAPGRRRRGGAVDHGRIEALREPRLRRQRAAARGGGHGRQRDGPLVQQRPPRRGLEVAGGDGGLRRCARGHRAGFSASGPATPSSLLGTPPTRPTCWPSTLPAGTRVIAFAVEHHANMLPWRRFGVTYLPIPAEPEGILPALDAALAGIDGQVLVAMTGASNVTGELWPVAEAGRRSPTATAPASSSTPRNWRRTCR